MFDRGLLTVARFRGAPLRVHWTLPLGILLFALPAVSPGGWVGAALVLSVHVIGRLVAARIRGRGTAGLRLHLFGGDGWHPRAGRGDRVAIAWGGVLGQLALALIGAMLRAQQPGAGGFAGDLVQTLVGPNLVLAVMHLLIPFEPFAGRMIWRGGAAPRGGRGPGGLRTSRELQRRQERAMAEGRPPPDDAEITASIKEALKKAADEVKKKQGPN